MITVKVFKIMGRGLVSTKPIKKGQVYMQVEILEFNRKDSNMLDKTLLGSYVYDLGAGRSCIALGHGCLFNHSDQENTDFNFVKKQGRLMIQYKALRNIKAGEQLFINYGYNPAE